MVIAVVVAVVLAAVVGGYFALRPSGAKRRQRSELRTQQQSAATETGPPTTVADDPPATSPADRFETAASADALPPPSLVDLEGDDEADYEYIEVIEYVDYDYDDDEGDDDADDADADDAEAAVVVAAVAVADEAPEVDADDDADEGYNAEDLAASIASVTGVSPSDTEIDEVVLDDDLDDEDADDEVVPGGAIGFEGAGNDEPELELVAFDAAEPVAEIADPDDQVASVPSDASDEAAGEVTDEAAVPVLDPGRELADVIELDDPPEPGEESLAEVVAELIDEADPDVADVMARLIDASDPQLVARLIDAPDLEVAEVVALLVDAADPAVAALVSELAGAPDRRDVAEVLRLVDSAYGGSDAGNEIPPEVAAKLEELDIEADLELTSRPGEMSGFAQLGDQDKLRVIIRVLCGLVGRDDLPPPRRGPRSPASLAEQRMWPLSRARWPVPPPSTPVVKADDDGSLPARRQSTKAS